MLLSSSAILLGLFVLNLLTPGKSLGLPIFFFVVNIQIIWFNHHCMKNDLSVTQHLYSSIHLCLNWCFSTSYHELSVSIGVGFECNWRAALAILPPFVFPSILQCPGIHCKCMILCLLRLNYILNSVNVAKMWRGVIILWHCPERCFGVCIEIHIYLICNKFSAILLGCGYSQVVCFHAKLL